MIFLPPSNIHVRYAVAKNLFKRRDDDDELEEELDEAYNHPGPNRHVHIVQYPTKHRAKMPFWDDNDKLFWIDSGWWKHQVYVMFKQEKIINEREFIYYMKEISLSQKHQELSNFIDLKLKK